MPVLLQSDETLYIGIINKLITLNLQNGSNMSYDLPPLNSPENPSNAQKDLFNEVPTITTISISKNGKLLVVSTHNRQVVTYNTKEMTPISNFMITRAASKICFDKENNILIADKTGDAYLCRDGQEPVLLLGHLSMLLDIEVSSCGKYVITSDRDEKIRVSCFPNCYNILCYCLGHQEFVTNIAVVNSQLLSASGDGTIRLWDYTTGEEILQLDTNKSIHDLSKVEAFKDVMDKDNIEVNAIPLTDMQVYEHREGFALIALTLLDCYNIELYEFDYKVQSITHVQQIPVKSSIICFSLNRNLCILTKDDFVLYSYDNINKFELYSMEIRLFKEYEDVLAKCLAKNDVSLLYKRKFDNVQEYLDRKKQRLEGK